MKYYVGVDIGGMSIKVGIVDSNGKILSSDSFITKVGEEVDKTLSKIVETIKKINNKNYKIEAIGVGIPGVTNSYTGVVVSAVNIGWIDVKLVEEFKKFTFLPVFILNDANAAALGEYKFTNISEKYSSMVMITLGTGVGGGIIINKSLFQGATSSAGEIGHMIINYNGEKCNCGAKGCFEQYASASALIRQTKEMCDANPDSILAKNIKIEGTINGKTAFDAEKQGCEIGKKVVQQYVSYIATGIISVVNCIHPEAVVIGGGISKEGDAFIERIAKEVNSYIEESRFYPQVEIMKAKLMNDAGIIGAAAFAIDGGKSN